MSCGEILLLLAKRELEEEPFKVLGEEQLTGDPQHHPSGAHRHAGTCNKHNTDIFILYKGNLNCLTIRVPYM